MMKNKKTMVVLYCRTCETSNVGNTKYIERQLEQLKDYCEGNDLDIQGIVKEERSGHSRIGEKSLSDFIGQENGEKITLLATDWNVFSSSTSDIVKDMETLRMYNIQLKTIGDRQVNHQYEECLNSLSDYIYAE